MIKFIILIPTVFVAVSLIGYLFHYAIHQKWMGSLYRKHETHHTIYPPDSLISDSYRDAGNDNTTFSFLLLSIPIVVIIAALVIFNVVSLLTSIFVLLEMSLVGWVYDSMHDSFHIRNSRWRIVPGYERLRTLHIFHHCNQQTNFGIFMFWWDRLFRTFFGG